HVIVQGDAVDRFGHDLGEHLLGLDESFERHGIFCRHAVGDAGTAGAVEVPVAVQAGVHPGLADAVVVGEARHDDRTAAGGVARAEVEDAVAAFAAGTVAVVVARTACIAAADAEGGSGAARAGVALTVLVARIAVVAAPGARLEPRAPA